MKKLILLSVFMSANALAVPQLYTSCQNAKKIISPKESAGHVMSSDCHTVFVLPPKKGRVYLNAISPSISKTQCQIINSKLKSLNTQVEWIQDTMEANKLSKSEIQKLKKEKDLLRERSAEFKKAVAKLEGAVKTMESKIGLQTAKLAKAQSDLDACLENCDSLSKKVKRESDLLAKLELEKVGFEQKKTEYLAYVEVNSTRSAEIEKSIEAGSIVDQDLQDRHDELLTSYQSFMDDFDKGEGAVAQVVFENTHQELVESYREKNEGAEFDFVTMPVSTALVFNVRASEESGLLEYQNAVRSYGIPGIKDSLSNLLSSGIDSTPFGASVGGNMILSTVTGCALFDKSYDKPNEEMLNRLAGYLSANAYFKYQVQTNRNYTVKYNLAELYKKIVKRSSKGGFFKTKSILDISEESKSDNTISIVFNSNHTSNQFENVDAMISSLRAEIVAQAIQNLARVEGKDTQVNMNVGNAPKSGAEAASSGLKMCPHLYCQVGAVVLDIGHAIFGSKEQQASFLKTVNVDTTYTMDENRMVDYYGSYTFDTLVD